MSCGRRPDVGNDGMWLTTECGQRLDVIEDNLWSAMGLADDRLWLATGRGRQHYVARAAQLSVPLHCVQALEHSLTDTQQIYTLGTYH